MKLEEIIKQDGQYVAKGFKKDGDKKMERR